MDTPDPQLQNLLRQWRAPAAPANLEANVWRQIRLARSPGPTNGWLGWLWPTLWHPALSLGAAAVVGMAVGLWAGVFSVPVRPEPPATVFLAPGTLTGAYAKLASVR